jgi:hypothetical protein
MPAERILIIRIERVLDAEIEPEALPFIARAEVDERISILSANSMTSSTSIPR